MPRQTAASLRIDPNIRAVKVYPADSTKKTTDELQTIGIQLTKEQAVHLARVLLAMAQEHDVIDVTGYRSEQRQSDGTYKVTVTSMS